MFNLKEKQTKVVQKTSLNAKPNRNISSNLNFENNV
jgi:hypothetical protein